MMITAEAIRGFRLRAHHLDRRLPAGELCAGAGACGVQNSPPGAWETALFLRVEGAARETLRRALWEERVLLQAWSIRGVPLVFPAADMPVFLAPLAAEAGEEPWIYTRGITAALDFLGMDFDQLLPLVKAACGVLEEYTVVGKEELDRVLAERVRPLLPPEKRALWDAPSLYGRPDRQTMGGAAVSFLLRPCSFSSLVVFGGREGTSPAFTAPRRWLGQLPPPRADGGRELVRRFLRCYGPSTAGCFQQWLGSSPRQAKRLWQAVGEEMEPVETELGRRYALAQDIPELRAGGAAEDRLLLLGPHDPYLDLRDRSLILADKGRCREVWQTVSNPGAVLRAGRVIGVWRARAAGGKLELSASLWEPLRPEERRQLAELGEAYAAFRQLPVKKFDMDL